MSLARSSSQRIDSSRSDLQMASAGIDGCASALAGDLNANQRALEGDAGAIPVNIGISGSEVFLRSRLGGFGTRDIDFGCEFGGLREHRHAIRQYFGKTANHGNRFSLNRLAMSQFTDAQFGHQRGVP